MNEKQKEIKKLLYLLTCIRELKIDAELQIDYTPKNRNEELNLTAQSNLQKSVSLSQMFSDTDAIFASPKGVPSSATILDIPIGMRDGKIQKLLLKTTGYGSAHTVLIGGVGSGKSNLLHTIIMSACYKYSPEELNLYLVDFKCGVEFEYYEANKDKKIPHIKLTSSIIDVKDGIDVLNKLHEELQAREDEFRKCRVVDIVEYRNLGKRMPKLFVIIDEIQELFEQDERLGQQAIEILSELLKKGRAFGINILLALQKIPYIPGLKDKLLSQIGNRISLRLSEPDDALDIQIDPKVVRNLNRPEKGLGVINVIYENESIEFRVAFAGTNDDRQDYLEKIIEKWGKIASNSTQKILSIEELNMTDITKIMSVIKKINAHCNEIDTLEASIREDYSKEKKSIEKKSAEMISDMQSKYEAFKTAHFVRIRTEIEELVELLRKDYDDEWSKLSISTSEFMNASYEENERQLHALLAKINEYVQQLNSVNFDTLVPPVKVEIKGESFVTYTGDRSDVKQFDCNSKSKSNISDPKPIRNIIKGIMPYCRKAELCIDALISIYDKTFNISGFNSFVKSSATAWLAEVEAKMRGKYSTRFDELFRNEKAEAIPKEFFTHLEEEGVASDVDLVAGTSTYNESITIGDVKLLVEEQPKHLEYIKGSPVLSKYLDNGYMVSPLILNLKDCGNILLNINEENYSDETINFVNQLIIQFLLSFPANRINFCLIDIDNKMGFSQFKSLTKINNNILFNGIIRDDRQLENTIKDMEQTMYKIDDDILSYNNVEDIYEYNKRFEANPQNVHLFVLVNYPTGMRDDTAKRVMKIIQNGNKAGIFSIIINNKACPLAPGYKPAEFTQFIENTEKSSLVINKSGGSFSLNNLGVRNRFVPKKNISVSSLASIIEMLKDSAESNRQKVIPLSQMFGDTDTIVASPKGVPSSAEVLDIPIGARGGEIQNLLLKTTGDGSAHAVLIGGTGSGKSNLLHTIIMSACYKYSPEELNLYLVDFKGGVEFKYYEANKVREKQIPHIKLTGLTSDVEDGVAILNNLHKELRRREEEFNRCNVEDIVEYRNLGKKIPRLFVIIDEIQELFEQDERLGQKAIDILRELFKKGRAFGINILWASQNVPNAAGLKSKVLSQIGNRISLRLNDPDEASAISIDPKAVKNLNRPEKGLGVINDIRYGNESIEFRVAFAEKSENRQQYSQQIIDKWKHITDKSVQEPLFIVGDVDEASPVIGNTIYNAVPTTEQIVSKSFDSYVVQLGQDYVTGKPYDINLALRENKMNLLLAGYDVELLRDMMGYSLLSIIMNQMTNADCVAEGTKIYYANGEMINPKNSNDLFNVIRSDFDHIIENVSATDKMVSCIKNIYKIYKERSIESDSSEYAKVYTPYFFVIHSMQRYTDLFNENPMLKLAESTTQAVQEPITAGVQKSKLDEAMSLFSSAKSMTTTSTPASSSKSKMPDSIFFADAVKELLDRGGKFGVHFIISIDNPFGISAIKNDISETMYKVFVKGININVVTQMLGSNVANSLNNPKVALVAMQDERTKVKVYRYDQIQDASWYKDLCSNYNNLRRKDS